VDRGGLDIGVATAASGVAGIGRAAADPLALAGNAPRSRTVGVAPHLGDLGTKYVTSILVLTLRTYVATSTFTDMTAYT
jgi:hypothetical protein